MEKKSDNFIEYKNNILFEMLTQKLSGKRPGHHWPVINVPNAGLARLSCHVLEYVYSNKGNFILKGFEAEGRRFKQKLLDNGFKWFSCSHSARGQFKHTEWEHYDKSIRIELPRASKERIDNYRFKKTFNNKVTFHLTENYSTVATSNFKVRRLPKKWIPELDPKNLFPEYYGDIS